VEVAAYYVISEALANAVKHSGASRVIIDVRLTSEADKAALRVEVTDDGAGGADESRGSGLQGLRDRLAAVEGRLDMISPPGQGTRVRAVVPCE
jgi:signal transduction histidine kinase